MATGTAIGQKGNWRGRYSLSYSQAATTTTVVCYFYLEHVANSGKLSRYHYYGTFDGTNGSTYYPTTASIGGNGNGSGETVSIGSVTKTYSKKHTAQTLTKNVKVTNSDTGSNVNVNVSIPIPIQYHYTVSYNANGGTGSSSNTKWYGEPLQLSNGTGFSRSNYTLIGWNTAADGSGTHYDLGGSLTTEQTTGSTWYLYAEWELNVVQARTKINDVWVSGNIYVKINDNWEMPYVGYVKVDGTWEQIT